MSFEHPICERRIAQMEQEKRQTAFNERAQVLANDAIEDNCSILDCPSVGLSGTFDCKKCQQNVCVTVITTVVRKPLSTDAMIGVLRDRN